MEIGYFTMPSHPPECGLKEGHDWDLQTLRWLDELGYQEAWIGEHHTAPWEPHPSPDLILAQAFLQTKNIRLGPGYQVPFAQAIREATGLTTIAVGLITEARQAEEIIATGKADMVALARAMLYDPRWGWHAAAELGGEVFAPPQYWRSQPSTQKALFGATTFGTR